MKIWNKRSLDDELREGIIWNFWEGVFGIFGRDYSDSLGGIILF